MLDEILKKAAATDRKVRCQGLEELGDYLEYSDWTPEEVAPILERLTEWAVAETDPEIREILLNDLLSGVSRGRVHTLNLEPIAELARTVERPLIPYCLELLGLSQNARFMEVVREFLGHSDPDVRESATHALQTLEQKSTRDA